MSLIAYGLRADYDGTVTQVQDDGTTLEVPAFTGGLIAIGADRELDVRQALDDGKGVIVIDGDKDPASVIALDEYPALKRTDVPAKAKKAAAEQEPASDDVQEA